MDYLIQFLIAVVPAMITGFVSYLSAVKTSNNEIEKMNVSHKNEMEKMEKEMEKELNIQKEMIEIQKESGENEIMNSLVGGYMEDLLKGKSPRELQQLNQEFNSMGSKKGRKR